MFPVTWPADERTFMSTLSRSIGPFSFSSNAGCSRMPASAGTSRASSGSDSLSELICMLTIGFVRYCWTAPSTDSDVSAVRSASFSTYTVSSWTDDAAGQRVQRQSPDPIRGTRAG